MNDYQLPVILTREFDLGVAVTRLIAGGMVERYPDLKFVVCPSGRRLGRLQRAHCAFVLSLQAAEAFDEYFDRLYFDMAGFEGSPIALRCALEGIKPERMVFATDYPQNFNNSDPKAGKSVDGVREYIDEIRRSCRWIEKVKRRYARRHRRAASKAA